MKREILEFVIWDVLHGIVRICERISGEGINEKFLLRLWVKANGGN